MMKRMRRLFAAALALAALTQPAAAREETQQDAPALAAACAVVTEADSGRVLLDKNADEPRLIASTTKIMTALLAIESCDLDSVVTVLPEWTGIEGSSMYLRAGQQLTVRELLYGLMLASGNDAAVALACLTAGSVEAFAERMNERAAALGCEHTHFENPNGLDGTAHYASALDLARITREAIQNEDFREIVSSKSRTIGENTFTNHNRLLRECEGVFGVKTGYTQAAGRTLVSCCERGGTTLICVTLSDPDDWRDHAALYDWAYDRYAREELVFARVTIPVVGGQAERVAVLPESPLTVFRAPEERVTLALRLPSFVHAAVEAGAEAGSASVLIDGAEVCAVELVYDADVERTEEEGRGLWRRFLDYLGLGERKIYSLS